MKTINKCFAIIGTASLLAAPNLFASFATGTVTVTAPNGGGTAPYWVQTDITSSGPNLQNFWTFCLAPLVDFVPGAQYNYDLSTTVVPNQSGSLNYVTLGTAWLYSQYRQLNPLVGNGGGANAANSALQLAIWFLQGDISSITGLTGAQNLVALAAANISGGVTDNANGAYGVYSMNITRVGTQTPGQPLLAVVPEPSTVVAGALLLLPFGVSTLRILRKKQTS